MSLLSSSKQLLLRSFGKRNWISGTYQPTLEDEILVIETKNGTRTVSTICPHFGGPLVNDEGTEYLRCLWHDWRFDIETGACINREIGCKLKIYEPLMEMKEST
jgi:nitrite reductase/ring-hydroxylating ferredoxin subunit